jgi:hypothetical protein
MADRSRREFLRYLSATGVVGGLAGCSNVLESSSDNPQTRTDARETATTTPDDSSDTRTDRDTPTDNSTDTQTATPQGEPVFQTSASLPDEATFGDTVAVTVTVENTGTADGSERVALRVGGELVDTKVVSVPAGETRTASLEFTVDTFPDDRTVQPTLNRTSLGELTVRSATEVDGTPVAERTAPERSGATYVLPKYRIDESVDVLNEGAQVLEKLGSRVFKGWLSQIDRQYPFAEWPDFESPVSVMQHPRFQELLDRDFDTYVFTGSAQTLASERGGGGYFYQEFTEAQARDEADAFYEVSKYLLETYDGTGTEFVFQNWEGDWIVVGGAGEPGPPDPAVLERAKRWFNARQRGISRARREVESDVVVLGACEINRVRQAMEDDEDWIVNTILPELSVDLVSYSAWDVCRPLLADLETPAEDARTEVRETLEYIHSHAPAPDEYTRKALGVDVKPVYVGEYGLPIREEGIDPTMRTVRIVTEEALDWGAPYTLFWQTYDNEVLIDGERVVVDPNMERVLQEAFGGYAGLEDVLGYYLVRPDGTRSPMWFYFADRFGTNGGAYIRLDLDFETTVAESTLNPDVEDGQGRELACACFEIVIETEAGQTTLDIGSEDEEGTLAKGVFSPENTGDETFRWFGRPGGVTTLYVHRDEYQISGSVTRLRLTGSGANAGLATTIRKDGTDVGQITLSDGRETYDVDLPES